MAASEESCACHPEMGERIPGEKKDCQIQSREETTAS